MLYGVSRVRINQIELKALEKIRAACQAEAEARGQTVAEWLGDCEHR